MSLAEKVDIVHEQLIEQEEIKLVDLPTNIKAKIKGWNLLYAKLKKSEEGYAVWCPSLPGCASQGDTREEAIANIQDAIKSYLEVLNDYRQFI